MGFLHLQGLETQREATSIDGDKNSVLKTIFGPNMENQNS